MMIKAEKRNDQRAFIDFVRVVPKGQGATLPSRHEPSAYAQAVLVYSLRPFAAAPTRYDSVVGGGCDGP